KALKGVIWSVIESWGGRVISMAVFFLLARLLGPESFGLIALAGVFLAFIKMFLDQGFSQAIVQRQEIEPEHLDTAFWTNVGISILLSLISVLSAPLFAYLYKQPELIPILRWLSLSFVFGGLSGVQSAILQRQLAFKALAIRSLIATVIGGIVGVTMAFLGYGVWSLVGQQLVNSFVQVLALWWVSDWRPRLKFSLLHAKELFTFGINIFAFNIINFFNRRSDDLLIGYFLGPVALGYYSVAYRLLLIMTQTLISTTTKVTLPIFSKLQGEPERLRKAFYNATQMASLIAIPMFLGVAVLAPEIVRVLFGEEWIPSIQTMQILTLIGPLHMILFFNSSLMVAMGKPNWKLWIQLTYTVNILAFFLVVKWGIEAVAAAYVIRGYLLSPISLFAIKKLVKINLIYYLRLYFIPLAASFIMISSILLTKYFLQDLIDIRVLMAVSTLLGILVYFSSISIISPKTFKEIVTLVKSIRKKKKFKQL
ncbi:MAG: lipopolysaccharide biosynthesis protein, partial [Rivularia sp. (in: cyanobacteria)]